MSEADQFDAFYVSTRERLLLQAYALTGDLPAALAAVEDAYVVVWHHWRKATGAGDPEEWMRPVAWSHARRRHRARPWHRDRSDDPGVTAALDGLRHLSTTQRRVLLLTHLSSVEPTELARELSLPSAEAAGVVASASAAFAERLGVGVDDVRDALEPLRGPVRAATWPRATLVRRDGAARRRVHTAVGAGAVVAVTLLAGAVVAGPDTVRPRLAAERLTGAPGPSAAAEETPPGPDGAEEVPDEADREPEEPREPQLLADDLLDASQLERLGSRWRQRSTSTNTEGDGRLLPCQEDRFADPRGRGALVRGFATRSDRNRDRAWQATELSVSRKRARGAYAAVLGWYAGCREPRTQLLQARTVRGVGDQAGLLVLRSWGSPVSTTVVGLARTGATTTATVSRRYGAVDPAVAEHGRLLAAAVNGLCGTPGTARCAAPPSIAPAALPATGPAPGMISEIDMPPVAGVTRPWVGTAPRRALRNVAATSCDRTEFASPPMSNTLTRTFVIPGTRLPATFGLTETVGTLPARRAAEFIEGVRRRVAACGERDLGTEVQTLAQRRTRDADLLAWRLQIEVSDDRSVPYLMGVVRNGTAVGQLGFYPAGDATTGTGAFVRLLNRAGQRLALMPPPDRARPGG